MIVEPFEYQVFIEFGKAKDIPDSALRYIDSNNLFVARSDVGLSVRGFYSKETASRIGNKLEGLLND